MSPKLAALIARLDEYTERIPLDDLREILETCGITPEDLCDHRHFSDECYQRNLVRETETYHLYAMCWGAGQASPIHDHAGSACGLKIIEGEAAETVFTQEDGGLRPQPTCSAHVGHVCVSYDGDTHRFGNATSDRPMISMHIYTPPLQGYQIFDDELVVAERV